MNRHDHPSHLARTPTMRAPRADIPVDVQSLPERSSELEPAVRSETASLLKPIGFAPREISALINSDVVARHADEAPFLWLLRDRAAAAPHYSLLDLAKLDERVEANLDGLRVAGDYGWRAAR